MANDNDDKLNVPIELIPDLNAKERYLFHSIACLNDKFDTVKGETDKQTDLLNKILAQTTITNGRVTKVEDEVEKVKIFVSIFRNKWFWPGVAVVLLILVPIVTNAFPPAEILMKIFGL